MFYALVLVRCHESGRWTTVLLIEGLSCFVSFHVPFLFIPPVRCLFPRSDQARRMDTFERFHSIMLHRVDIHSYAIILAKVIGVSDVGSSQSWRTGLDSSYALCPYSLLAFDVLATLYEVMKNNKMTEQNWVGLAKISYNHCF